MTKARRAVCLLTRTYETRILRQNSSIEGTEGEKKCEFEQAIALFNKIYQCVYNPMCDITIRIPFTNCKND